MLHALDELVLELSEPSVATRLAETLGCRDLPSAGGVLATLPALGVSPDLLAVLLRQLASELPAAADPDVGLANLARFIAAARSPQALLALFERDPAALSVLVKILSISQSWADQLTADPESFDLLRMTEGLPVSRAVLVDEMGAEVDATADIQQAARILRTHKQRETMRIAYGEFIGAMPLETVTGQLTILAEAILEAAMRVALREAAARGGRPQQADGSPARLALVGFGSLGGAEMSYAPDLELWFIADAVEVAGKSRTAPPQDYFERVARRVVQLISDPAFGSVMYRIEIASRGEGSSSPAVVTPAAAQRHFENFGRTWERLGFIKARPVAGDRQLADEWIEQLEPWVYRRYLTRADMAEIAALKRHIGKRALEAGSDDTDLAQRTGGLRDIEFLVQFLQLISGGDAPSVHAPNTLSALGALEQAGWLTAQERSVLDDNYRYLRRLEHYLQIMFGADVQRLPAEPQRLRHFLQATGFRDTPQRSAADTLRAQLGERAERNRRILDHLLSEAFSDEAPAAEESDLVLEPAPAPQTVARVLGRYGFSDPTEAYRELVALGREHVSFLSTPRCRHFLSAIAPRLLQSLSQTPTPDQTLATLGRVSESLGGKAVLWELFQSSPAAMDLCVRLCAASPYLVGILTSNPGMIDELIDSLMLNRLPVLPQMEQQLADMCRGVEDPGAVLHSFKNSMHLGIGVRDVLGKDDIARTHGALSDVAEACLKQVIDHEYHRLVQKLGEPIVAAGPRAGEAAELIVLAVGKLGGREPNYHSDLDVLFLFDGEGTTRGLLPHRRHVPTPNRTFFNQLSQRIVKSITRVGPAGSLYELDARLRPLGGSVGLAMALADLEQYFCHGPARLAERLALCKARPVWASPLVSPALAESVRRMQTALVWEDRFAEEIRQSRLRLEEGAAATNIKRGSGGTLDVEFVVQMLQLKYAATHPAILTPGTIEALQRLQAAGLLEPAQAQELEADYRTLRETESGLRLMNLMARHDLPHAAEDLNRLEFLLSRPELQRATGDGSEPQSVLKLCETARRRNREIFHAIFDVHSRGGTDVG
jgi:[glutamine synthetase] adenylyltransferase / [glutamine synthetase]-adenylyl-L-tyrosine phosphorylase